MAAPLVVTSLPFRTSPVKRGAWLLETVFNRPPTELKVAFTIANDTKERKFIATLASATAATAFAKTKAVASPLIEIQFAGQSLLDEGMECCLDTIQATCHAYAVFLYSHSYYAAHGRAPELYADHGVPIRDERRRKIKRVWLRHHPEAFKNTSLAMPEPTDEYGDRDLFAETVEACKKRGLKFYARILQPHTSKLMGRVENFELSDTMKSYPLEDSSGARSEWGHFRVYCGKEPFRFVL